MSSTEVKTYRQKERKQGLVDINKGSCMKQNKRRRLFQERTTNEVYYNSFFLRTIRDWNQLPLQVISANSLEVFRAGLAISPALHWSSACSLFVNSFNLYIATWGASFPVHHAQTLLNQSDMTTKKYFGFLFTDQPFYPWTNKFWSFLKKNICFVSI